MSDGRDTNTEMPLTEWQSEAIKVIAAQPDGVGKHAAFMRCVLGERNYFELVLMSRAVEHEPLDEATMRYITAHWHDKEVSR